MEKVEKKRQKEQYVVEEMIRLYCRKNHPKEKRQKRQGLTTLKIYQTDKQSGVDGQVTDSTTEEKD